MHFTRLRLNGFKSFVDPTDLVIQPGLTGVVGPNGCGKSNLLEALRWIMGENRPTAMRGAGMEDVIFAGTDQRGARHFAEVTLQIDNSDRRAPAGFNDSDMLDIVRRITRDAGSAYRINGKEARARDVAMLFADASTGAHSPALVRQGQISELINAKPRARRRILEEAAGISGLYARRHEAELRLRATETNLERVGDLIDQLATQLAQLGRQAKQAERYRAISARLRQVEGMLLYRRWREADAARLLAETDHRAALSAQAQAERAALDAEAARMAADAALPPLREEEAIAAAIVQRMNVQRDTLAGDAARAQADIDRLEARLAQIAQDVAREAALNADATDQIRQLDWEAAQLARASDGQDQRIAEAVAQADALAAVQEDAEITLTEATEQAAQLAAVHQAVQARLADLARQQARQDAQSAQASQADAQARADLEQAEMVLTQALAELQATETLVADAEATLTATEAARAQVQADEAAARLAFSDAQAHANALATEAQALERAVARGAAAGPSLLDDLRVTKGYETALAAALGDDVQAPRCDTGTGWRALPGYDDAAPLPEGAAPLAGHVSGAPALVRRLSQTGVVDAGQGAALQVALRPGQRLVSIAGDVWRWDGLHLQAGDAALGAALQLQNRNRLEVLRADLPAAQAALETARALRGGLQARLDDLTRAEKQARDARRAAESRLSDAARAASRAQAARDGAQARRDAAQAQMARARAEVVDLSTLQDAAQAELAELPDPQAARDAVQVVRMRVDSARADAQTARSMAEDLKRQANGRTRRAQEVAKTLSGWRHRLDSAEARRLDLQARQEATRSDLNAARSAPDQIALALEKLSQEIARADTRLSVARDMLSSAEAALRHTAEAERASARTASDARETCARLDARLQAAQDAVVQAAEQIMQARDMTPDALLVALETDPDTMPDAQALDDELGRLKRAREALGAVNLRAEQDAREVGAEHDTLTREKADLEAAIAKLRAGISALNREGRERLLIAFDKVNANFATLFTHLFQGGEARLVLVESDDPLDAGLEIMCQPPGKKLATLSLLSGGEQTLTALALIFGVFLANPAPICVLDEVDAPLDDANVARFCDLLDEMTRRAETRYLIITHNAITMARMDRLFGVTMAERGVSQLVSVDLKAAETLVA